jgi:beta-lactamase regulating signal transducer with metallopeptidase domain
MIYVSAGLIRSFDEEHLQVALAHEIGHIRRSRIPLLIVAYVLRMLVFFNPLAMIEFRRLAHDEEKICDDIAIELTGKSRTLAEAIEMLRPEPEDCGVHADKGGVERFVASLEHYSHDIQLKSRVARIAQDRQEDPLWGFPLLVTIALIMTVNYHIV